MRAAIALLFLAGCATTKLPDVQRVEIPVPVPCKVAVPARPDFAVDHLEIGSGIWRQMQALRAERLQRQGYEIELEAALQSCR